MPQPYPPVARRVRRVLAMVVATAVWVALASSPAHAIKVHVRAPFFGLHDSRLHSLSRAGTGSIRLWNTGTAWNQIEVSPGHYDWTRLNEVVTAAQTRNVQVTLVLAMTPRFYASAPQSMPPISAWKRYVRHVMKRYKVFHGKRGIAAYEVWNEGNVVDYWKGTPAQLAHLNRVVYNVRNAVDPGARVISPSFATRLPSQVSWLAAWASTKVGPSNTPVWKLNDATGLSFYPMAQYGSRAGRPEDSIKQYRATRSRLTRVGVPRSMPIWDVEINYGVAGGPTHPLATPISSRRQAAYVVRTYLLNAAAGVKRVFWFKYDLPDFGSGQTIANTVLTDLATGSRLTVAGRAFYLVQKWMKGTMVGPSKHARPCAHNSAGTYTCMIKDAKGVKRIYWNPGKKAHVRLHKGSRSLQSETGATKSVRGVRRITVNYEPVMVRSSH